MRVAALYDIHGNLPALEAVLEDLGRESIDEVVVGGDVYPGPMSNESHARLLELRLPVRFIQGNGDRETLALARGGAADRIPEPQREAMRWVARRLDREHQRGMSTWPDSVRVEIDGLGHVLFCHATPRSDTEIFTRLTPKDQLVWIFQAAAASLVVCGHTHMQFDLMVGEVRVVNAGSVGMPFAEPGAYWLLLGPEIELRKTDYDLERAADRIRATGYPGAHEFAERNVLRPRSERQMLDLFSRTGRC